jgi:hypothetical protein
MQLPLLHISQASQSSSDPHSGSGTQVVSSQMKSASQHSFPAPTLQSSIQPFSTHALQSPQSALTQHASQVAESPSPQQTCPSVQVGMHVLFVQA